MKTFDEIKEGIKENKMYTMQSCMQSIASGTLSEEEKNAYNKVISECQSYIDNIDEVAIIEIGADINDLIGCIQKAYKFHLNAYWDNFEKFISDYVIGVNPDGRAMAFGSDLCYELGIDASDLLCFKGCNPMSAEAGDLFKQSVNSKCGTNIPMSGVEEQALKEYETLAFSDDELEKSKAYVRLKEIQRDSGLLKNGSTYYILENNQAYQKAKSECSGRKN